MLHRLKDRVDRARFSQACAGVLRTPPARTDPRSQVLLLTQLQHKDVLMALIAFKSFMVKVPVGQLCIVDDGSLTADDRALLTDHLPGAEFLDRAEVRTPDCPTGGCWERLLWIARLSRERYVVQLDSDTLTLHDLPEVVDCTLQGRSFAIGTWDNQEVEPMTWRQAEAVRHMAMGPGPYHVQLVAEASFNALQDFATLHYVRGCAGFSGFARGSVEVDFITAISAQMRRAIGDAWDRWGSEQVMSNIVVANGGSAQALPHPRYCDCTRIRPDVTAFIHFIGSCRFVGSVYRDSGRAVISQMQDMAGA